MTTERTQQTTVRSYWPIVLPALAFVVVYLLAVCTKAGQQAENSLIVGYAEQARIFKILYSVGPPPLKAEWATLIVGMALIAIVTAVRRQWIQGIAAAGVAVATIGSAELFNKALLPRPDISSAPRTSIEASFPSGHVAIVAGLSVAAVLIASPRTRRYVAAVGVLWLAVTSAAVQALYWHRPSDVIGATLLACAWFALATRLLPAATAAAGPGGLPVLTVAAVAAVLAGSRTDAYARPLVFAASAFLCAVLLWTIVSSPLRKLRGSRWGSGRGR